MEYENDDFIIEQARNLLSAYIDEQTTVGEAQLVERALHHSPQLQTELKGLQQTVKLVQALPRVPTPQPFTLSEADIGRKPAATSGWPAWFKPFAGAAAALTAVVVVGFMVLNGLTRTGGDTASVALAPAAPAEVMMMEAAPAEPDMPTAEPMPALEMAADAAKEPAAEAQSVELPAAAVEKEAETDMAQPMALEAAPAPAAEGETMMRGMTQPETETFGVEDGAPSPMASKAITATEGASLTEQIALPMVSGGGAHSAEEAVAPPQSPLPTAPASEPPPAAQPAPSTEMPLWGQFVVIVLGILVGAAVYVFLRRGSGR